MADFTLHLRCRELFINDEGNRDWRDAFETQTGAAKRLTAMVPKMNAVVHAARDKGAIVIHAPSNLMHLYADNPARQRALAIERAKLPEFADHDDPPQPVPYGE